MYNRNIKNIMKKSFVIDLLKANNKKRIKKQESKKQEKNRKKHYF